MEGRPNMVIRDLFQPELNDEILAACIAQHDIAAFEIVYDRFVARVFSLAAMLTDIPEAERIVLQVFSQLWLEIDQFIKTDSSFQDWLLDLTRKHLLVSLKSYDGQMAQHILDATNHWLSEGAKQATKTRDEQIESSSGRLGWQAFQDLNSEQRTAIVLAYYGGFKQREIAQLLSLPQNLVEQYIRHGLHKLRETFEPELVLERG